MQINNVDKWLDSFRSAIALHDTKKIHSLLQSLPQLYTEEDIKRVLILSMDAETMICSMRQDLVNQRTALASQYSI